MKNKFPYIFITLILSFVFCVSGIANGQNVKSNKAEQGKRAVTGNAPAIKKVSFNPIDRNPFLSKEETIKIDQMRKAEQRRLAAEEAERKRQAEEARKRLIQQQILEDEIKRHPARAVMYKIQVDGILGRDAIVNGEVVSKGSKVLGATVVSITDNSVWFTYKGERFQRKMPLM
ncbi:MAG: hypothetical protein II183_00040 [Elusimicrobiaceae bacterium]|nr:hypothetical protein [Elusimicrobiaceae bacterium]